MNLRVLVPLESERLFGQHRDLEFDPVYYRVGTESFLQKTFRKAGLRNTRQALEQQMRIGEGIQRLNQVAALWLSPEVYLPPTSMDCLLDLLPDLKWVYSQVTGTDHLDLEMFRKRGVMVSNSGNMSSRRVAEMALACVCAHAKRLPEHLEIQRNHLWHGLPADDLCRQTVGILGTGNIGKEVAALCRAIGMRVIGASRDPGRFGVDHQPYHRVVDLERGLDVLLAESDHVIVALPLNEQTRGLIGSRQFAKMKRSASLVNVARGAIVHEAGLCAALAAGEIAAAYIDRPSRLPLPWWSPIYRAPNLVLTHYSAAHNPHRMEDGFNKFMEGLQQYIQTGQPPDRVA